jgi:hypothetical protein
VLRDVPRECSVFDVGTRRVVFDCSVATGRYDNGWQTRRLRGDLVVGDCK